MEGLQAPYAASRVFPIISSLIGFHCWEIHLGNERFALDYSIRGFSPGLLGPIALGLRCRQSHTRKYETKQNCSSQGIQEVKRQMGKEPMTRYSPHKPVSPSLATLHFYHLKHNIGLLRHRKALIHWWWLHQWVDQVSLQDHFSVSPSAGSQASKRNLRCKR